MTSIDPLVRKILGGSDLIIADAGGAYGLPQHLATLDRIATVCLFEPHHPAAEELRREYQGRENIRVFGDALAKSDADRILYVTNVPTGSSLLKPGSAFAEDFGSPDYFYPLKEVPIKTRALAGVLRDAGLLRVDAIKIDVQGAELEVLQGLGAGLEQDTLSVEMEVGFPGAYIDQPSFGTLDTFMMKAGFTLFDLRQVSHHRHFNGDADYYASKVFGVAPGSRSLTKRTVEADAVYFRRVDLLLARRNSADVRRLTVLMCCYGFFIEALDLLDRADKANVLSAPEAPVCREAVIAWHAKTRDEILEKAWFERAGYILKRISRIAQRRLLGKHFGRWLY